MAAGCGEAAEMMARAAAMVLVGAVAGLGRLGGGSGRCLGPPWSAGFERSWAASSEAGGFQRGSWGCWRAHYANSAPEDCVTPVRMTEN